MHRDYECLLRFSLCYFIYRTIAPIEKFAMKIMLKQPITLSQQLFISVHLSLIQSISCVTSTSLLHYICRNARGTNWILWSHFCFQIDQQWMEIVNLCYPISCLLFFYFVCVSTFIMSMSISFAFKTFFVLSKFTSLILKPTLLFVYGVSREK